MNVGRKAALLLVAAASAVASVAGDTCVERIFREPRLTRGDTNVRRIQPIDDAAWIWDAQDGGLVKVFRCSFETKPGEGPIVIDVSADERFYLTVDGRFVARGPNRAQVENWQYQTYRLNLPPGRHEMRAVVTHVGDDAPRAQLSWRGGFILKAEGAFDGRLTTGRAPWQVGDFKGMRPIGTAKGVFGTGSQFEIAGRGPFDAEPSAWRAPVVVREPVDDGAEWFGGHRSPGWMLYPSQLPDQIERRVAPGGFRAATHAAEWRTNHVYTAEETAAPEVAAFNALLRGSRVVVPARTRLQLAWHLDRYVCAYPELVVARGEGARVSWTWTESARDAATRRKGRRDEIVGKYLDGYGDVFLCDGGVGTFSSPWFRCGLWCRIDIETRDEPLEINAVSMVETRYPLEMKSRFESPDDPTLADIRRISAHTMQMCCHEMLFDCPYYEQQMYPGDARLQMLVLSSMTRDDRMARRVMDIYALATHDDGLCPFNWPSRGLQEGFTYTLCYLLMYGDYAMNHADFAWLRSRLPDLRKSMSGCELYENADGLVEGVPGWNFMDWAVGWSDNGVLPGTDGGRRPNAFVSLFWLLAIESAATTERALGNDIQTAYWEAKAVRLKHRIFERFWDESRGLVADTLEKNSFSEHVQALAIISDALPESVRATCFRHLVEDADLVRTTVYFSYYLFEAYFKMGRADLFLKRLDLWRDYVGRGMTTVLESPDSGVDGGPESRSDCHAWGAHPLWFMATGLAGIRSAAPGFARVCVAPQPGALKSLLVRHPHPLGLVEADLRFGGGRAEGIVRTPVPGVFRYGGCELPLAAGTNDISALSAQTAAAGAPCARAAEVKIDFGRTVVDARGEVLDGQNFVFVWTRQKGVGESYNIQPLVFRRPEQPVVQVESVYVYNGLFHSCHFKRQEPNFRSALHRIAEAQRSVVNPSRGSCALYQIPPRGARGRGAESAALGQHIPQPKAVRKAGAGVAYWNAAFQKEENGDWSMAKKSHDEYLRIRRFFPLDFHNHGSASADPTAWAIWQHHDPKRSEGVVLAFRRLKSPCSHAGIELKWIPKGAVVDVENLDSGEKTIGNARLEIVLPESRSSTVLLYRVKQGESES